MLAPRLRSTLVAVAAVALAAAAMIFGVAAPASASATLYVGTVAGDYATITGAVAAASADDLIVIRAGTYNESVTVGAHLDITGYGPTTVINGGFTFNAPVNLSFVQVVSTGADPVVLGTGSAGSHITDSAFTGGLHSIYAYQVVATAADPTIVNNNFFEKSGSGNTGSAWFAESAYVNITNNVFDNTGSGLSSTVAINSLCGTSHVHITGNHFHSYTNSIVMISNGACATINDVLIDGNASYDTESSSFYFGGNNITNLTVSNNTISNVASPRAAIQIAAGYSAPGHENDWIAPGGPDLSGILFTQNTFGPADFGIKVGPGVLLSSNTSIVSKANTYNNIVTNSIVGGQAADGPCVTTTDDVFNNSPFVLNVCVANTPAALAATGVDPAMPLMVATGLGMLGILAVAVATYRRRRA